jgi:hypothetical protein
MPRTNSRTPVLSTPTAVDARPACTEISVDFLHRLCNQLILFHLLQHLIRVCQLYLSVSLNGLRNVKSTICARSVSGRFVWQKVILRLSRCVVYQLNLPTEEQLTRRLEARRKQLER